MGRKILYGAFEWDEEKDSINRDKHGVGFVHAVEAFLDPQRVIAQDECHSVEEERLFCLGMVQGAKILWQETRKIAVMNPSVGLLLYPIFCRHLPLLLRGKS